MTDNERAEAFFTVLNQLGYKKTNTGRWVERVEDSGQGFPQTIYNCPFCNHEQAEETNYCPECGAKLK